MGRTSSRGDRRQFLRLCGLAGTSALASLVGMPGLRAPNPYQAYSGQQARLAHIRVDLRRKVAKINRNIYGHFIEHLGRCIYGGIYDEGSPLSDSEGFRKDVLEAARRLRVPILRWPGGNFASSYHWIDGIGPKSERPRKFDTAWFAEESNRFGTDEFISYCRKLGAEPYICVNMGTGTAEEAAAWVEYCNATTDTYYANLRRKHGHSEPYNVKYWGLGNEIYGIWQAGHKTAEEYAKQALEFAKMMRWVDPTIKLVACGANNPDWDRVVLENLIDVADYISIHIYVGGDDYYELLATAKLFDDRLRALDGAIEAVSAKPRAQPRAVGFPLRQERIQIAFDEWNIWYRRRDGRDRNVSNKLEERYNLRDALWTASILNLFQRWSAKVTMANLAQMVNVIAPIFTSKDGLFLQPNYFPFQLYVEQCGDTALDTLVDSPNFSTSRYAALPYLDAQATTDDNQQFVSLAVVNRHRDKGIATLIEIEGAKGIEREGMIFEINGKHPEAENSFSEPNNVGIKQARGSVFGESFQYEFPAHSVTLLKMRVAKV